MPPPCESHAYDSISERAGLLPPEMSSDCDSRTSASESPSSSGSSSLSEICADFYARVGQFLNESGLEDEPVLRAVQRQVRLSMGVIDEALSRYECVFVLFWEVES